MATKPNSPLEEIVLRLLDHLTTNRRQLARFAVTSPGGAQTGRCRYNSNGTAKCEDGVTKADCDGLNGVFKAGAECSDPVAPTETKASRELSVAAIKSLCALINKVNDQLPSPEPAGACWFTLDDQNRCVNTTHSACAFGLRGTFIPFAICPPSSK
jgi:hypothetical protein